MIHIDLFSGIGGFALAAEAVWPDIEHVFCDNDPFCQAILKKHWPTSTIYGDIRTLTNTSSAGTRVEKQDTDGQDREITDTSKSAMVRQRNGKSDAEGSKPSLDVHILTGGFPCQPFSQAGRRKGTADDRYLWPEMFRVISEFHPRWVIAENVGGLVTWNEGMVLEQVCADLEGEGYEVQPFIIPAVSVGAPHRRDRVWIVAHASSDGDCGGSTEVCQAYERKVWSHGQNEGISKSSESDKDASDTQGAGQWTEQTFSRTRQELGRNDSTGRWSKNWPEVATRLCTLDDGLSNGLVRPRGWRNAALKAAGNAIVPQVAAQIMRAINEIEYAKI